MLTWNILGYVDFTDSLVLLAAASSQSWTDTGLHVDVFEGELSLRVPPLGVKTDSRVSVFVHDRFPGSRSACEKEAKPQGGDPAALSLWAQNRPLLRGLAARGLPEGEDILFADHNTQTKAFVARPYQLHLHRKHPLFARKTFLKLFLFTILPFASMTLMFCFSLHPFFSWSS